MMAIKCSSALNYTNVDNPFYCFFVRKIGIRRKEKQSLA